MKIIKAQREDFQKIWPIFQEVVRTGTSYAIPKDIGFDAACRLWMDQPRETYIAEENGRVLGTYYIKTNQDGPGDHVCNCGYMVAANARCRGVATSMCEHSQMTARDMGYLAMQFNLVVSANTGAVRLWKSLGYDIAGCLPKAFRHPQFGFTDAYVMVKQL